MLRQGSTIAFKTFATLHFILIVDDGETFLDSLDLIDKLVATLDILFPSVCELDLVFSFALLNAVLDEWICGGLVIDTTPRAAAEDARQSEALANESDGSLSKAASTAFSNTIAKLTPTREFKKL